MFGILSFYIELVVFSCFSSLGFSLKIARNTRLGERVCILEDTMRMVKIKPKPMDLETAMQKFLLVKESQHTGDETMKDYRNCLARFLADSHNSLDYPLLESDVLTFFAAIPDTSPARYNKPFQNINAFLNWALEQELIEKNPIKVHKLHKRRDDGNIKPLPVDKLQAFLASLDKSTYTGLRDYVICMVMLDTGIRPKELLALRDSDYHSHDKCLVVSRLTAKTRMRRIAYLNKSVAFLLESFLPQKPEDWEDWLFPSYEGQKLSVSQLDKSFAHHSEDCGIKLTPYQLRHSFATLFLKNGGDLFSLQHLMGHSDLRMTKRYVDLDEEHIAKQHDSFSPAKLISTGSSRLRRVCQ